MGENVAILEETDWIGGQMTTAGVGTMDEGSLAVRNDGIYGEFAKRAAGYYKSKDKSVDTCYYGESSLCVEPRVGQLILRQMLDEQGNHLKVYTGIHVSSVTKDANTVTGVVANGQQFSSKVLVDADPYGDVLSLAGAAYRLGNNPSDPNACVQDITYSPVIKYYPEGVPNQLQFKAPPPGFTPDLAKHFASFLANNGYDLAMKDAHHLLPNPQPKSFKAYAAYRGLPDLSNPNNYDVFEQNGQAITRTSLDLGNDYPKSDNLSTKYISDPAFRAKSNIQAELLSLQLMYYIQHDLGQTNWSIADDEGYDTTYNKTHHHSELNGFEAFEDQMPQQPYIREGRRAVGTATLTGSDLKYSWADPKHIPAYKDSVAVGYYPMDLHGCRKPESPFDSAGDLKSTYAGGAFEVPIGVLIPKQIDGLLVTDNNISASHYAEGATREQPITMSIGQAAGALAAEGIQKHQQPRNVNASDVRAVLRAATEVTDINSINHK